MRRFLIVVAKSVLFLISAVFVAVLAGIGYLLWRYDYSVTVPDLDKLAASPPGPVCSAAARQNYLTLDQIPLLIRQTVVLSEQPGFYERTSLNPFVEIASGLAANRPPRGSGIMISVARCLASLKPDWSKGQPNVEQQVGDLFFMAKVARTLSRDRILETYLNETYFGRGAYGVAAASETYFGKPLDRLGIDEIAFIAALPRAPGYLSKGGARATERRNMIINRLLQAGAISDADAIQARERPLEIRDVPSDKR
jgi:membrane peptidoglycan carboxypeptidase